MFHASRPSLKYELAECALSCLGGAARSTGPILHRSPLRSSAFTAWSTKGAHLVSRSVTILSPARVNPRLLLTFRGAARLARTRDPGWESLYHRLCEANLDRALYTE